MWLDEGRLELANFLHVGVTLDAILSHVPVNRDNLILVKGTS